MCELVSGPWVGAAVGSGYSVDLVSRKYLSRWFDSHEDHRGNSGVFVGAQLRGRGSSWSPTLAAVS